MKNDLISSWIDDIEYKLLLLKERIEELENKERMEEWIELNFFQIKFKKISWEQLDVVVSRTKFTVDGEEGFKEIPLLHVFKNGEIHPSKRTDILIEMGFKYNIKEF